jgi:cell division transport system ATP-binding protein
LLDDRTVYENVEFAMVIVGASKSLRRKRVPEVLNQVGLADRANAYPDQLSGGEKQRVAIARAIINNPHMLVADEPTGNLDAENGELILALLDEIRRQKHTAIILSTHNMQWPEYFPGTVYRCVDGKLIKEAGQ